MAWHLPAAPQDRCPWARAGSRQPWGGAMGPRQQRGEWGGSGTRQRGAERKGSRKDWRARHVRDGGS